MTGSAPCNLPRSNRLPSIESYDVPGQYAFATDAEAQRYADLRMQEQEARSQLWQGRSTVRTLRAGTTMTIIDAPLRRLEGGAAFTILRTISVGINNFPTVAHEALAALFGTLDEELFEPSAATGDIALAIACPGLARKWLCNSWKAISTGRSSWAPCTTAAAAMKTLLRPLTIEHQTRTTGPAATARSGTALRDDYVHDSRAWFKLIPGNPDSEKDMHAQLQSWVDREKKVRQYNERMAKRHQASAGLMMMGGRRTSGVTAPYVPMRDGLTPARRKLAEEYAKMEPAKKRIPVMKTERREPYGFGSKAGYLRFRKIYGGWDSVLLSEHEPHDLHDALAPDVAQT